METNNSSATNGLHGMKELGANINMSKDLSERQSTASTVSPPNQTPSQQKNKSTVAEIASTSASLPSKRPMPNLSAATVTVEKKRKHRKPKREPHALIWVCTHGKAPRSRGWGPDALHMVGVYQNKEAAAKAKAIIMSRHNCFGRGDICIGHDMRGEIDLVIRPTEMFLDEDKDEFDKSTVQGYRSGTDYE